MKNFFFAIILIFTTTFSAQMSFNTGSVSLDTDLNSINVDARVDLGVFNAGLSATYNISEKKIEHLSAELHLEPAEIYLSLELGRITNRSIDDVIIVYKKNKGKGWGVIAKELGIKPGSAEFHALKNATKSKKEKGKSKGGSPNKGNSGSKGNSGKGKGKK